MFDDVEIFTKFLRIIVCNFVSAQATGLRNGGEGTCYNPASAPAYLVLERIQCCADTKFFYELTGKKISKIQFI